MCLELRYMAADPGLRHAQLFGGGGDAAPLGDSMKSYEGWQPNRSNILNHGFKLICLF